MESESLRVHDLAYVRCPLLGPSLYIWVQGCPRRCDKCFNQATLDEAAAARVMTPQELARQWQNIGGGLVLSGGEPFSQARGLTLVCQSVRAINPQCPILAYTGYYIEELLREERTDWLDLLGQLDVLVDGPFIYNRRSDFPLTGSDNQRVILLSDRIPQERLANLYHSQVQLTLRDDGGLRIVGTGTSKMDMNGLIELIRAEGIRLEEKDGPFCELI